MTTHLTPRDPAFRFGVYVTDASKVFSSSRCENLRTGYLSALGRIEPFMALAVAFKTVDEAKAQIAAHGWKNDPSTRLGQITAYVVEVY